MPAASLRGSPCIYRDAVDARRICQIVPDAVDLFTIREIVSVDAYAVHHIPYRKILDPGGVFRHSIGLCRDILVCHDNKKQNHDDQLAYDFHPFGNITPHLDMREPRTSFQQLNAATSAPSLIDMAGGAACDNQSAFLYLTSIWSITILCSNDSLSLSLYSLELGVSHQTSNIEL